MRKVLENLMERAAGWLEIEARHRGVYRLSDDERAAVRRGLQEARDGKLASDEAIAAVFGRAS